MAWQPLVMLLKVAKKKSASRSGRPPLFRVIKAPSLSIFDHWLAPVSKVTFSKSVQHVAKSATKDARSIFANTVGKKSKDYYYYQPLKENTEPL